MQTNLFSLLDYKIKCIETPMIKTHGQNHRIWLYNYKKLEWSYHPLSNPECIFNQGLNYKTDADRWYKWKYTKKRFNEMLLTTRNKTKNSHMEQMGK